MTAVRRTSLTVPPMRREIALTSATAIRRDQAARLATPREPLRTVGGSAGRTSIFARMPAASIAVWAISRTCEGWRSDSTVCVAIVSAAFRVLTTSRWTPSKSDVMRLPTCFSCGAFGTDFGHGASAVVSVEERRTWTRAMPSPMQW